MQHVSFKYRWNVYFLMFFSPSVYWPVYLTCQLSTPCTQCKDVLFENQNDVDRRFAVFVIITIISTFPLLFTLKVETTITDVGHLRVTLIAYDSLWFLRISTSVQEHCAAVPADSALYTCPLVRTSDIRTPVVHKAYCWITRVSISGVVNRFLNGHGELTSRETTLQISVLQLKIV